MIWYILNNIKDIKFIYKHCYKCKNFRYLWKKSYKPYVIKVTKGTNYNCLSCDLKYGKN